jgi:hypothetical protein
LLFGVVAEPGVPGAPAAFRHDDRDDDAAVDEFLGPRGDVFLVLAPPRLLVEVLVYDELVVVEDLVRSLELLQKGSELEPQGYVLRAVAVAAEELHPLLAIAGRL